MTEREQLPGDFNLSSDSVYSHPDTVLPSSIQELLKQPKLAPTLYRSDCLHPDPCQYTRPESTVLTATELREQNKDGFLIQDGGMTYIFPIAQLLYIEEKPDTQKIIICWIEDIQIRYSTYDLSKIAWHGPIDN